MIVYIRWISLTYWLALTIGLLHPKGDTLTRLAIGLLCEYPDVAHFTAFVVLAVLVHGSRLGSRLLSSPTSLSAYALVTEAAQVIVPGLTGSLTDGLANVLGIAAGTIIWRLVVKISDRRHGRWHEQGP